MPRDNTRALPDVKTPIAPFAYSDRPPVWLPDTIKTGGSSDQMVFPEEAIGRDQITGQFVPFQHPVGPGDFQEPASADPAEWLSYNQWILGYPLNPPSSAADIFNVFLAQLCADCRRYNASLYNMRRLHRHATRTAGALDLAHNPHGGQPLALPTPGTPEFETAVAKAEADWLKVCSALRKTIEESLTVEGKALKVYPDMVRVNGYIVSLRTIARIPGPGEEFSGISSSHNSLSSPMSSS